MSDQSLGYGSVQLFAPGVALVAIAGARVAMLGDPITPILAGAGALGIALIAGGVWLLRSGRRNP